MTPQEFCYWLQGFVELGGARPDEPQWALIKEHLKLVFDKVTPPLLIPSWWPSPEQPDYKPTDVFCGPAQALQRAAHLDRKICATTDRAYTVVADPNHKEQFSPHVPPGSC